MTRVSLFFSEAKDTAEMQLKKKNKKKKLAPCPCQCSIGSVSLCLSEIRHNFLSLPSKVGACFTKSVNNISYLAR